MVSFLFSNMKLFLVVLLVSQNPDSLFLKADSLFYAKNYDDATRVYQMAATGFVKINQADKAANAYNDSGLCFYRLGRFDSAEWAYRKAIELDMDTDSSRLVLRLRNLAIVYSDWGKFEEATIQLEKARVIALRTSAQNDLAPINNALGNVFLDQGINTKALLFFKEALRLYRCIENQKGIAIAYTNLGINFAQLENIDSSLYYYHRSISLKKALRDTSSLAYSYNGLGKVHFNINSPDSAEYYFLKAYEIRSNLNQALNKANTANELARYYLKVDALALAKRYLDDAYQYALDQNNRTVLMESLELLGKYHRAISNYAEAYAYLDQWSAMRDSIFNESRLKVLALQSQYDLNRSEAATQLAEKKAIVANSQKQRAYLAILFIGILLLVTIVFALIFHRQRRRLKSLSERLSEKNQQIAALNKQNFHFTKNSLAEIVSMLNIQLKNLDEGLVKETLTAEKLRMETINLLYQQLFALPESGAVELSSLLSSITQNTFDVILGSEHGINLQMDQQKIHIGSEKALSIGMIVNEICLNACKHAFEKGGVFQLILKEENNFVLLQLSDDGPGYTEIKNEVAFGLQLIDVLTKELDAQLSIDNTKAGLSYYFRIPLSPHA